MWSKRSNHPVGEVTLHVDRFRRTGQQRFFVGKRDSKNGGTRIVGSVLEGHKDPVFVGELSVTPHSPSDDAWIRTSARVGGRSVENHSMMEQPFWLQV